MFIVWGSKGFVKNFGQTVIQCDCPNCRNQVTMEARQYGRKFTFFWIPLFTTSSHFYVLCPICEQGNEISRDMLESYLPVQELA